MTWNYRWASGRSLSATITELTIFRFGRWFKLHWIMYTAVNESEPYDFYTIADNERGPILITASSWLYTFQILSWLVAVSTMDTISMASAPYDFKLLWYLMYFRRCPTSWTLNMSSDTNNCVAPPNPSPSRNFNCKSAHHNERDCEPCQDSLQNTLQYNQPCIVIISVSSKPYDVILLRVYLAGYHLVGDINLGPPLWLLDTA